MDLELHPEFTGFNGLQGWWRMGDGDTYPTLLDNSTNGHNATMTEMSASNITTDVPK